MHNNNIIKEFKEAQAILQGHFILSSGLHSDTYLQGARVFMDGKRAERLCQLLSVKIMEKFQVSDFDYVMSPAMGGVVVGYEMGKQLELPAIFCERDNGKFALRRGFSLEPGSRVLVVEDVVTTGKSSLETFACIEESGGKVIAEACLVDRSGGRVQLGVPLFSLLALDVKTYEEHELPEALMSQPAVKLGSRFLKQ
jgi:orotate phosphoribosyltransferase